MQRPRDYSFATSSDRTITVLQHQLLYKDVEESMGPNEVDCPMRIMNQLEGHPPIGEYSASWRERALRRHQDMKPNKTS